MARVGCLEAACMLAVTAMMQKFFWGLIVVLILLGLTVTIHYGLQPRPVSKIGFSEFKSPAVVAQSLRMILRQELKESSILFWGVVPNEPYHKDVLMAFLSMQEPGDTYGVIVVDPSVGWPEIYPNVQVFSLKENHERLIQILQADRGQRVLVILPHVDGTQYLRGNLADDLKKAGLTFTSISFLDFPRRRDQESAVSVPCDVAEADLTGAGRLGCLAIQRARALYRQPLKPKRWVGVLDQIGGADYLFLLAHEQ